MYARKHTQKITGTELKTTRYFLHVLPIVAETITNNDNDKKFAAAALNFRNIDIIVKNAAAMKNFISSVRQHKESRQSTKYITTCSPVSAKLFRTHAPV